MLTELCQELRNWFDVERHCGDFEIVGGALSVSFLQTGQYFRIKGSIFNDGVFQYGVDTLNRDESFHGEVWAMAVPPDVIELNNSIDAWQEKYGNLVASPYQSESFGGYSYSKASGSGSGSSDYSWKDAFASSLRRYRKL